MKNMYGKSKGKIHPDGVGGGSSSSNNSGALQAALALLPAAILTLAAALSPDDREVLAYLVSRSFRGPAAMVPPEDEHPLRWRPRGGKGGAGSGHHHQHQHRQQHGFECGCFDCYRGFWCRWDASSDRELIHQAIEAFEEHLTSGEVESKGRRRGARGRNRGKGAPKGAGGRDEDGANVGKGKGNAGSKNKGGGGGEKVKSRDDGVTDVQPDTLDAAVEQVQEYLPTKTEFEEAPGGILLATDAAAAAADAEAAVVLEPSMDDAVEQHLQGSNELYCAPAEEAAVEDWQQKQQSGESSSTGTCSIAAASGAERRRGGWADVMGLFNSRLWSLWSPGA